MAVPAHDERDFEFALKFGLPILPVIDRPDGLTKSFAPNGTMNSGFDQALLEQGISSELGDDGVYITIPPDKVDTYIEIAKKFLQDNAWNEVVGTGWIFIFSDGVMEWESDESEKRILERCKTLEPAVRNSRTLMEMLWDCEFYRDALYHHEYGMMINSGEFSGTPGDTAVVQVNEWLEQRGFGKAAVNYHLRDWLISRQRYWGTPIPIIYCAEHGAVPSSMWRTCRTRDGHHGYIYVLILVSPALFKSGL
jgi:leucyl-tRNA synthetase